MIAIGRYFVFMISVTATISFPRTIDEKNLDLLPFYFKMLVEHNNVRADHGAPRLLIDNELCKDAKEIRNKINNNQLHLIPSDIGWNQDSGVFNGIPDIGDQLASRIFRKWYNTSERYDFENEPCLERAKFAAPFTQIVWKATKRIGISLIVKDDGTYDIIVVYSPKGNQNDQYLKNVRTLKN